MSKVSVIALGKIGLPLAVQFAQMGHMVTGVDINEKTVRLINKGIEPFPGEKGLAEALQIVTSNGRLQATTETTSAVTNSDVVVIVVPVIVDAHGIPDFEQIDAATKSVGNGLKKGSLVSYETTLPIGSTRHRFAPALEELSGLQAGKDFALVFSPERVLTGRVFADLRRYPKLVGGFSAECGLRAEEFYTSSLTFDLRPDLPRANGVWNLGSCEASEMAKLAETTYRDVNIGLANQFSNFAQANDIDIFKVIEACNSQPFSHIHQPGIAVGGHCIPIYPQMYFWNDPNASIVQAARNTNVAMPNRYIQLLAKTHGPLHGESVLILGAAYRGGVKETAFSGVFPIVDALRSHGAHVSVSDPLYSPEELRSLGLPVEDDSFSPTAIVIQADHSEYSTVNFEQFSRLRTILNGRNIVLESVPNQVCVVP